MLSKFIVLFILFSGGSCAIVPSSNSYTHSIELLENEIFYVFWKYNDTTITFEVHAKTLGWVGFGLTPSGGMTGSDVTITWIKDGQTFFSVSSPNYILNIQILKNSLLSKSVS